MATAMAPPDSESTTPGKTSAPKDKSCPFCSQAFTSSSLGRHLDLYIRPKNPKPSDGVHDVEAIRKLRGAITRRQPRGSLSARKGSTPAGTPRPTTKREPSSHGNHPLGTTALMPPRDGPHAMTSTTPSKFVFVPRWEATGVMRSRRSLDKEAAAAAAAAAAGGGRAKQPEMQTTMSRQVVHKSQLDMKQKLSDAVDTARAAELALRELLGSWRAAKQHIETSSMPFDFDPLALDFPALTLQCLHPPPTLFSSTQNPTSTSWAIQPPGQREFRALQVFFKETFGAWTASCAAAATAAAAQDVKLAYPPASSNLQKDAREAAQKKEDKVADSLETLVEEHLHSAFAVWDALPAQRQQELWILELARGVGRKLKEVERLKDQQHRLKQENANLKMQVDQLNRLQQPREWGRLLPCAMPNDRDGASWGAYERGARDARDARGGQSITGLLDTEDGHVDIATLATKCIERWKNVITSTRVTASGMAAQRPLDRPAPAPSDLNSLVEPQPQATPRGGDMQPKPANQPDQANGKEASSSSVASGSRPVSEHAGPSAGVTGPPSVEEETSDQDADADADAEMEDDDSFAVVNAPPPKQPLQRQGAAALDVRRTTQGLAQQQLSPPEMQFMMQNGSASPAGRSVMVMAKAMPSLNLALQGGDATATAMQQVGGDALYMDGGL
ncbi:uncharacterized protein UV8b_00688 [Ustilaginoidea virens]|uniref:Uncharacterized protein n=1 Tax=Ustilaginoidea virens TaxID=1159556 RepID=A0A8E5MEK4_USTVR|nr:uncharacterized protein UV8b_00688 [Ustilaginoidea virens]QUC16447.1 hypothetical protein UV8b_00688 [Ustilaginoidea virens]